MNKNSRPEQFQRNTAVALIICFLLLIWLPALDGLFHLDRAPMPNENRALATFPTLPPTVKSIGDVPAKLEAYYRDHFGFRNRLILWASQWKRGLLKESNTAEALAGRDGWLYNTGDFMMENFQGLDKFTPRELQAWQKLLEKRRDWLAERGIKYIFVVPPDKQSIYPEFLPAWLAQRQATNKLDQFFAYMNSHSTVEVLDLRPVLLAGKKSRATYLQTDIHWNFYGALLGYQALIKALRKQMTELSPAQPLSAFEVKPVAQVAGDVARLLGLVNHYTESNAVAVSPRPPLPVPARLRADERLAKKWKPQQNPVATEYAGAAGKAVVFHDSFACAWYDFLGLHFHEVVYVWQYDWDAPFLEREKPTVVIDEIVEHFFETAKPGQLFRKDALP